MTMLPVAGAYPTDVALGPDGNLWITDVNAAKIRRVTPSGGVSEFDIPSGDRAQDITAGPDGKMWFTELYGNRIGRVDPGSGAITEFPLRTSSAGAWGITAGPDGNVWFTEYFASRIGRITPSGVVTEVHIPPSAGSPYGITTGSDGRLWFTGQHQVGALDPRTLKAPAGPCLTVTKDTTLTSDVGPCKGDGIVVTRSNITLDLNGHKVLAGAGPRYGDFAGIHLLGVSGVTVTGGSPAGSVSGFDAGVFLDFGSRNTIKGLNLHDNLNGGDDGSNLGDGIVAIHSANNLLASNQIAHSGLFDGIGVLGLDSNGNTLKGNTVKKTTDLGKGQGSDGLGIGIIVNAFLETGDARRGASLIGNNIADNVVRDNVGAGISNLSNTRAAIKGNRSTGNGLRPDGTLGNTPGNGIGVQNLFTATHKTEDLVQDNRMSGNSSDGVQVLSDQNRLMRNVVSANGDNGIDILGHLNQILHNASTDNNVNGTGYSYDLLDTNGYYTGDCDSNTWIDNTWGSAGFFPACTSAGTGGGPPPHPHAGTARPKAQTLQSARGRPLKPEPERWSSPQLFRKPQSNR